MYTEITVLYTFLRNRLVLGCLLVSSALLCAALIMVDWTRTGFDVSPADANKTMHQRFDIPAQARNVCFISTPRSTRVAFSISRPDFDLWVRHMEFRTEVKSPAAGFKIAKPGQEVLIIIENGVCFTDGQSCGISGSFDLAAGICCAVFSCK